MDYQRSFITHAHFYQPPREDPIDDDVPYEGSAFPYHDWNEKIFETCYLPNIKIGNFSRISFDLGPTLSRWLRKKHPDAMKMIVAADKESIRQTGYGNAIAQPYHHTILPLASREEKETEIAWGIKDFRHDFDRSPEGMWLPETAVDIETLGLLVDHGIKFTILAPWQIAPGVDVRHSPFRVGVQNGKEIIVFVYNAEISAKVSFDTQATTNADRFLENHVKKMYTKSLEKQYVLLATDGELYGHHQEYRDLFLGQLVNGSIKDSGLRLDLPAGRLDNSQHFPLVEIIENTSWSCHHGINRWREECGCSPGASWKFPLRKALDIIAKDIDGLCKKELEKFGIDFPEARDCYIDVFLGEVAFKDWVVTRTERVLQQGEIDLLEKLFKTQDYRLRMYASCGWFFDRLDRIEPTNNLTYAAYAVFLVEKALRIEIAQKYKPLLVKISGKEYNHSGSDVFYDAYTRFSNRII